MSICPITEYFFPSLLRRTLKALGRLQARNSQANRESIYIYDLVEQCTIDASCPVTAMLGYSDEVIHAMGSIELQQFQIQNLMALKVLHQEDFTILDNLGDRWNGVKSF